MCYILYLNIGDVIDFLCLVDYLRLIFLATIRYAAVIKTQVYLWVSSPWFSQEVCDVRSGYPSVKTSSGAIVIGLPQDRSSGSGQLLLLFLLL